MTGDNAILSHRDLVPRGTAWQAGHLVACFSLGRAAMGGFGMDGNQRQGGTWFCPAKRTDHLGEMI